MAVLHTWNLINFISTEAYWQSSKIVLATCLGRHRFLPCCPHLYICLDLDLVEEVCSLEMMRERSLLQKFLYHIFSLKIDSLNLRNYFFQMKKETQKSYLEVSYKVKHTHTSNFF